MNFLFWSGERVKGAVKNVVKTYGYASTLSQRLKSVYYPNG